MWKEIKDLILKKNKSVIKNVIFYGIECKNGVHQIATQFNNYNKNNFSDEAHFDVGGYVNKQNCRIWGTEKPHTCIEKPMHPKRVTVWCGF